MSEKFGRTGQTIEEHDAEQNPRSGKFWILTKIPERTCRHQSAKERPLVATTIRANSSHVAQDGWYSGSFRPHLACGVFRSVNVPKLVSSLSYNYPKVDDPCAKEVGSWNAFLGDVVRDHGCVRCRSRSKPASTKAQANTNSFQRRCRNALSPRDNTFEHRNHLVAIDHIRVSVETGGP